MLGICLCLCSLCDYLFVVGIQVFHSHHDQGKRHGGENGKSFAWKNSWQFCKKKRKATKFFGGHFQEVFFQENINLGKATGTPLFSVPEFCGNMQSKQGLATKPTTSNFEQCNEK